MAKVEFNYYGTKIIINCKKNEIMKNVCQSFIKKIEEDKNNIYFVYNGIEGYKFDENLTFEQMINSEDKKENKINLLAFKNGKEEEINDIIKSKDIICPICGECIKIDINNYKITLFECKNNHRIDNILLDEFENTQKIDYKKIICEICNDKNKSDSYNNIFYKCCNCKKEYMSIM